MMPPVNKQLQFLNKSVGPIFQRAIDSAHGLTAQGLYCRVVVRVSLLILALTTGWCESIPDAQAQDVPFTPRYDGVPQTKRKSREATSIAATPTPVPIYSFKRYEPELSEICDFLDRDGRRDKIRELSELQDTKQAGCVSCRFFVRQVVYSCRPKVVKRGGPPQATQSEQNTAEASPTPLVKAPPALYPSTELINLLSAFGTALYERDSGAGATFMAVRNWANGLVNNANLTPSDRGYFEIFREFLLAAWQNRPEQPLEPTPVPKAKIQELFE